jgi:hypothetical protein
MWCFTTFLTVPLRIPDAETAARAAGAAATRTTATVTAATAIGTAKPVPWDLGPWDMNV